MSLDLNNLKNAMISLEQSAEKSLDEKLMNSLDKITRKTIKTGVVHNFKITFELCWKFIQRWIRLNKTPEDSEPETRKDLFRQAAKYGLIKDPLPWFDFSHARN